ncbi:MAG: hypothetical protein HZB46_06780 [Solirubrobacterales bacterium]|nr:hypothetical protein [Solirubrobacterales bacterium]
MSTVLAMTSTEATIGLVGVFFVLFPLLLHGLIGFAVAQSIGEREDNLDYLEGRQQESQG